MAEVDTELLISCVEERSYLWDASHEDYKDRDIRLKGWQDIASAVVRGYESMQDADKKTWVDKVQKRWKTARDAYIKSRNKLARKKSGSGAAKITKYTYHEQLTFLDRVQEGPTDSNLSLDGESQDTQEEDESLADNDTNESSQQATDNVRTENFKRKRRNKNSTFEDSLIDLLRESKEKEDDDDKAFLTSLLPSLKAFNPDQKLIFRSQVLQIIMSIKQNTASATNMPPPFPTPPFNNGPSTFYPPVNFYPNQTRNQYTPYQQDTYPPQMSTPLPSPNPSTASASSWETL